MAKTIFLDGAFLDAADAKVSVYDHGLLYGDGIFEGIRAYNGNVFKLDEHLRRLYQSAQSIMLHIPYTQAELVDIVCETLRRNDYDTAYIRLLVTRGIGNLGLDPFLCQRAGVVVIAEPLAMFSSELYEQGISVITAATRRNRSDVLSPKVKSLNYLNNVLVKMEAHAAGASEALMLNSEGYVVEASGENIFVVKDDVLYTPPTYLGALEGITRNTVIQLARQMSCVVEESPFTRHDVYVADEVFLTGTAAEMVPVIQVDGRKIANGKPGPHTNRLHQAFQAQTTVDGVKLYSAQTMEFEGA